MSSLVGSGTPERKPAEAAVSGRRSRSHLFVRSAGVSPSEDQRSTEMEIVPQEPAQIASIWDAPVELSIELCRGAYRLGDVSALRPGTVVGLNAMAGDCVSVYAGSILIARGELIVIEGALAVRVSDIGNSSVASETQSGA